MKTVLTDRSLCEYTLAENAKEEHIFGYISALRDAGIRLVEMDVRTVIKMTELPDGVKYIYRITDPVFAEMAEAFDFDYVLLRINDLKKNIKLTAPAIVELSSEITPNPQLFRLIGSLTRGRLSMIRLRGAFPLLTREEVAAMVRNLRMTAAVAVDFLPERSPASLDAAIKLSQAGADCISLCMGAHPSFVGVEEYMFTLMSVFDTLPQEFNMAALCRAAVLHKAIFANSGEDSITRIMRLLDRDIAGLVNVDTGERVRMHVSLRDNQYLRREFVSALEKMAREQDMPEELISEVTAALEHFDVRLHSEELLKNNKPKGLVN